MKEMISRSSDASLCSDLKSLIHGWKSYITASSTVITPPSPAVRKTEESGMEYLQSAPKPSRVTKQERENAMRENQSWRLRVGDGWSLFIVGANEADAGVEEAAAVPASCQTSCVFSDSE